MSNPSIKDIAAEAKVSIATVSRAIHTPEKLHHETLERVMRIIKEKNYSYNALAANFSKKSSNAIGLFVPSTSNSTFAATIAGIQDGMFERGYYLVSANTHFNAQTELALLRQVKEQRFAGLLLTGYCQENEDEILSMVNEGFPLIVIWEKTHVPLNYVGVDHYAMAVQVLEYLLGLGHKQLGFILGPYTNVTRPRNLYRACQDVMAKHNLPIEPEFLVEGEATMSDGEQAMEALLRHPQRPTAVFCNSDQQAIGAINAIKRSGLRVPEDISVTGFDDIEVAQYFFPPLTTVHIPGYHIGYKSAQFLLDILSDKQKTPVQYIADTNFIVRGSTTSLDNRMSNNTCIE